MKRALLVLVFSGACAGPSSTAAPAASEPEPEPEWVGCLRVASDEAVGFTCHSAELDMAGRATIDRVVAELAAHPELREVRVSGHHERAYEIEDPAFAVARAERVARALRVRRPEGVRVVARDGGRGLGATGRAPCAERSTQHERVVRFDYLRCRPASGLAVAPDDDCAWTLLSERARFACDDATLVEMGGVDAVHAVARYVALHPEVRRVRITGRRGRSEAARVSLARARAFARALASRVEGAADVGVHDGGATDDESAPCDDWSERSPRRVEVEVLVCRHRDASNGQARVEGRLRELRRRLALTPDRAAMTASASSTGSAG